MTSVKTLVAGLCIFPATTLVSAQSRHTMSATLLPLHQQLLRVKSLKKH